jgi:hypothetical protein
MQTEELVLWWLLRVLRETEILLYFELQREKIQLLMGGIQLMKGDINYEYEVVWCQISMLDLTVIQGMRI